MRCADAPGGGGVEEQPTFLLLCSGIARCPAHFGWGAGGETISE